MKVFLAFALCVGLVPLAPFAEIGEAYADTTIRWRIALGTYRSSGDTRADAWANMVKGIGAQNKLGGLGADETWAKNADGTPKDGEQISYITPSVNPNGTLVTDTIYYYCNMPTELTASDVTGLTGELRSLNISLNSDAALVYEFEDDSIAEVGNALTGTVHLKKPGTTKLTIKAPATNLYTAAETTVTITASRRASTTSFDYESMAKTYGDASFTVSPHTTSDSVMSFSSSDPSVASINGRGTITINSAGTTTIRAYMYPSNYFEESSATFKLTVDPLPLNLCSIQVGSATWNEDASARKPSVTVSYAGKEIDPGNYSVSFSDDGTVGQGTATITGNGNLNGQATRSYTIGQKDATDAYIDLGGSNFEYTGQEIRPTPTVTDDGVTLTPSDYDVTYANNVEAGEASARIDFKGNYSGSVTRTFNIGWNIANQIIDGLGNGEFVYTGRPIEPALTVEGVDESCFDVIYDNDTTNVGEKNICVVGKSGGYGQANLTYRIVPKPVDESNSAIDIGADSFWHTGEKIEPVPTVAVDDVILSADDYDIAYEHNVELGKASMTINFVGNYDGSVTRTFDIIVRRHTVSFLNYDGSLISSKLYDWPTPASEVEIPENPVKPPTPEFSYSFAGWDSDIVDVTSDKTYTATYTSSSRSYAVRFLDYDGTLLDLQIVGYGLSAEAPDDPVRDGYTFTGWDADYTQVKGPVATRATYAPKPYAITFKDEDGNVLSSKAYDYDTAASHIAEPAAPAKASTAQYDYVFSSWTPALSDVSGNATYTATYEPLLRSYTVRFVDDDGTGISSADYPYGTLAGAIAQPTDPTKECTDDTTYTFSGWSPNVANVTGDATYTATYFSSTRSYPVIFVDWNGSTLDAQEVDYGSSATPPAAPARKGYTFTGWDRSFDNVTGALTVRATYEVNSYTVKFKNADGAELSSKTYDYGTPASGIEQPAAPAKPSDASYDYAFAGWSPAVSDVTGDTAYTAMYSPVKRSYPVTFLDYNGALLDLQIVGYGESATAPAAPTRTGYTFKNWDKSFEHVTGVINVRATYAPNRYTVAFEDEDGTLLLSRAYDYGTSLIEIVQPPAPAKASDAQYSYTFAGWDKGVTDVVGDAVYRAVYNAKLRSYTVTFKGEGDVVLSAKSYAYGTDADDIKQPAAPAKASTAQYDYSFAGWSPEVTDVSGAATHVATYEPHVRFYSVKFVDWDDKVLNEQTIEYGKAATAPADPTREGYAFTGWDAAFDKVTSSLAVKATYAPNKHTVAFEDGDGTTLLSRVYNFGTSLVDIVRPDDPTKVSDVRYDYTFAGWDKALADVMSDAVYKAVYDAHLRSYDVTFKAEDGEVISTKAYGYGTDADDIKQPTAPAKESTAQCYYTFAGWSPELATVTKDATYAATYDARLRSYSVKFLDWDGKPLSEQTVEYGSAAAAPDNPVRTGYTFKEWDKPFDDITGDTTVRAVYGIDSYDVMFKDWNGALLSRQVVDYGSTAVPPENPIRVGHTFAGWDKAYQRVEGDMTITAQYKIDTHPVTFYDWNGSILSMQTVEYGAAAKTPADPIRDGYKFVGWDKSLTCVIDDLDVRAIYTSDASSDGKLFDIYSSVLTDAEKSTGAFAGLRGDAGMDWAPEYSLYDIGNDGVPEMLVRVTDDAGNMATYIYTVMNGEPVLAGSYVEGAAGTLTGDNSEVYRVEKGDGGSYTLVLVTVEDGKLVSTPVVSNADMKVVNDYLEAHGVKALSYQNVSDQSPLADAESPVYTVTFLDEDGSKLSSKTYDYGTLASAIGQPRPTKATDAVYDYAFAGWDKQVATVTANATYTAVYASSKHPYTITFASDGRSVSTATYTYGETPAAPDDPTKKYYLFTGWDKEVAPVTADVTYNAKWNVGELTTKAAVTSFTYTGEPCEPYITAKVDGHSVTVSMLKVQYTNNVHVGSANAHVTVMVDDNKLESDVPFTISTAKTSTFSATANAVSVEYAATEGPVVASTEGAVGEVTFEKTAGDAHFNINADGTLAVRDAPALGSYVIGFAATDAGDANHAKAVSSGTVTVKVVKATNPLQVTAKAMKVAGKKRAKATKKVKLAKLAKVFKAQGDVTYKRITKGSSKAVKLKRGKVVVKKGTKAGVYQMVVEVRAAGNGNYNPGTAQCAITVKVGKARKAKAATGATGASVTTQSTKPSLTAASL